MLTLLAAFLLCRVFHINAKEYNDHMCDKIRIEIN